MSEIVGTWLLFTHSPAHQLADLIETLKNTGWDVPERGGIHYYSVDGNEKKVETIEDIVAGIDSGVTASVELERNRTSVSIQKNADVDSGPSRTLKNLYLWSWESEFRPPRDGWNGRSRDDATMRYVDVIRTAVEITDPDYGYGTYPEYTDPGTVPTYDDVLDGRVRGLFWLNLFGPKTIDILGRDRIESAPAWRVEELSTGHLLVVATDNPVDPSEKWKGATDAVAEHLGFDG